MYAMTRKEWRERIASRACTPPTKKRVTPTGRAPRAFLLVRGESIVANTSALTKSEARAAFKKTHGGPGGYLPADFRVLTKAEFVSEAERRAELASAG